MALSRSCISESSVAINKSQYYCSGVSIKMEMPERLSEIMTVGFKQSLSF